MTSRRRFVSGFVSGILAAPRAAWAQPAGKVYEIGLLTLSTIGPKGVLGSFIDALRELNYVEGRNLVLRRATAEFKFDRLPGLAADLVQARMDVIVTTSTLETLAAKRATSTIPIVMTTVPILSSRGSWPAWRDRDNVTGLTSMVPGFSQKYVQPLREAMPLASRFVAVVGPFLFPEIRRDLQVAAQHVGITVSFTEVKSPADFDRALARAKQDGAGGIIVPHGGVTWTYRAKLVQLALKHRLPGIYWASAYVEDGGLMSYGASFDALGRRAAYVVDMILKGAKPADLPVEQPTQFELVINLKTTKALGLTLPPSLLLRADQVIE